LFGRGRSYQKTQTKNEWKWKLQNAPAIEFPNVSLSFDERRVLSEITFKLERGEMILITGEPGSGKSVLLRLAIALEHPDSGPVLIEGDDVGSWSEVELLKLHGSRMRLIFYVFGYR
jgi:ABC-type transporter Mla maintaining outer membrane lipid asymmetry ATPase subunit MlaF